MTELSSDADLRRQLDRWVAQGLIDASQATRIEVAETARAEQAPGSPAESQAAGEVRAVSRTPSATSRAPLVAEALGYCGGVLAIAAGILMVREFWRGIPTGAELALAAVASIGLGAAGAALQATSHAVFRRLRSALWLMSTASLAAFAGVLAEQVWKFSPVSTALVAAAAATAYGAALWLRTRALLQHLAMFASAAVLVGTAVARLGPDSGTWGPGLGVWALSVLWVVAVTRGYLAPRATGYFAAGIGLLIGAQLTMPVAAGQALAVATVAGLLAAGVLLRQAWLVALGAVGVLQVVPQTAARYLPTSAAAPLAIFVAGVVLLGSAVWLAKRRAGSR
jgi:Predicted membrane protein (DUF2157)